MSAVSVRVFQLVAFGAAARGVDPGELLRASGIDPEALADPDGRLSRAAEARLWHEAVRLSADDALGLHIAEGLAADGFGALGFAVRSSATLGGAYEKVARYLALMVQGPVLEIGREGHLARLRHFPPPGDPPPSRHSVELFMAHLVMMPRLGVDPAFEPRAVRFRHPAPARTAEHARLLGRNVAFGAEHDEIWMDASLLDRPQSLAEPALSEVLDRHLAVLAASLPAPGSFLDRARTAVAAELRRGEPSLEAVAAKLRMSPRSLQRRLHQEGCSLTSLLDRVREGLALRYLTDSRESIAEVAFLLGFSDVSTFHRAFKRWTGVTPASYRRAPRV